MMLGVDVGEPRGRRRSREVRRSKRRRDGAARRGIRPREPAPYTRRGEAANLGPTNEQKKTAKKKESR
jgi:hypothetical protein